MPSAVRKYGSKSASSSRASSSRRQMPMIVEDENSPPPPPPPPGLPTKSSRRINEKGRIIPGKLGIQKLPVYSPPPSYTSGPSPNLSLEEWEGKEDKPPKKSWKPSWMQSRGGWVRLGIMAFLVIGIIVGVTVGVIFGVVRNRDDSSSNTPSTPSTATLFPAGSFAFTTALKSTSTACTSNPSTFRCFPFTNGNGNSTSSQSNTTTTFYWSITPSSSGTYYVSAAANPFAPQFTNLALQLLDSNQTTERYTFNYLMPTQTVFPSPLLASDSSARCYYNGTVMTATLWTKLAAENPNNQASGNSGYLNWPYRVEVNEVQYPGRGVPDCRNGQDVSVAVAAGTGNCACIYNNFGTGI